MRVGTLPRIGTGSSSGRSARSSAMRRVEPVPMRAPGASAAKRMPGAPTNASRGSSRCGYAPIVSPSASCIGRSLAECTARSMPFCSSAVSISRTQTCLPPCSETGPSTRSPVVVIFTISTSWPFARKSRAIVSACASASWLPRVPSLSCVTGPPLRDRRAPEAPRHSTVRTPLAPRGAAARAAGAGAWRRSPAPALELRLERLRLRAEPRHRPA